MHIVRRKSVSLIYMYQTQFVCIFCIVGGVFSAETACYTCGEFLCPDCAEKHASLRATKGHETCALSELTLADNLVKFQRERFEACSNHGDLKKLYCSRCEVDLCNVCVYEDGHQKHDVTSIHNRVKLKS